MLTTCWLQDSGLHADYVCWFLPDSDFTIAWFWLHSGRHCNDDDVNSADFDDDAVDDDDNDGRNNGKPSKKIPWNMAITVGICQ